MKICNVNLIFCLIFLLFFVGCDNNFSRDKAPEVKSEKPQIETPKVATNDNNALEQAKAQLKEAEEKRLQAEAEAKAAAEKLAIAQAAADEVAKAELAKATEKAEAKAKEDAEYAEKRRLEKKADDEKLLAETRARELEEQKRLSTRTFRLQHADAEEVATKLNEAWSGDFGENWKVAKVAQAFPESNTILVTAPVAILDACEKSMIDIDRAPQQIYVEARFVELSTSASHKLGIDWQMLDGMRTSLALDAGLNKRQMQGVSEYNSEKGTYIINTASNPKRSSANLSYINGTLGMDELAITLRALESTGEARVFSNPKIIVASGRRATVDMTTKYPNVKIAAKRTTNTGGDSLDLDMQMAAIPGEDKMMFAKEAFFSWGISLDVTPRVGTNGLINVQIVPTISTQKDWVTSGASSDKAKDKDEKQTSVSAKYPVIDVQRLVTNFEMASETTAVIGGLSQTTETQQDNGIPVLRDIWWIGPRLFGSKVRVKEQREIIIFVTVGLVEPSNLRKDAGLPKNAVLGRQYTEDIRREPGDRRRTRTEGLKSLDMRPLEEQYQDPRRTNRVNQTSWTIEALSRPFAKEPSRQKEDLEKQNTGNKG